MGQFAKTGPLEYCLLLIFIHLIFIKEKSTGNVIDHKNLHLFLRFSIFFIIHITCTLTNNSFIQSFKYTSYAISGSGSMHWGMGQNDNDVDLEEDISV